MRKQKAYIYRIYFEIATILKMGVYIYILPDELLRKKHETQSCSKCSNNLALGVQLFIALALLLSTL